MAPRIAAVERITSVGMGPPIEHEARLSKLEEEMGHSHDDATGKAGDGVKGTLAGLVRGVHDLKTSMRTLTAAFVGCTAVLGGIEIAFKIMDHYGKK